MFRRRPFSRAIVAIAILVCATRQSSADEPIHFAKQVAPILQKNCIACHHRKEAEAGLVLESYQDLMKGGDDGPILVAGKSQESSLIKIVSGTKEPLMPPADNKVGAKQLTEKEIAILSLWIDQGAKQDEKSAETTMAWTSLSSQLQPIYATASSLDGQFVAFGRGNQIKVSQWPNHYGDANSRELVDESIATLLGPNANKASHLDLVQSLAFSPSGDLLVSGGFREIKVWRRDNKVQGAIPELTANASLVASSQDGKRLATIQKDRVVSLIDLSTNQVSFRLTGHSGDIQSVAWSPNNQSFVSIDVNGALAHWTLPKQEEASKQGMELGIAQARTQSLPSPLLNLLLFDDATFAGSAPDGKLQIWKSGSTTSVAEGNANPNWTPLALATEITEVASLAILSQQPAKLVVGSKDGAIRILSLANGSVENTWQYGAPLRFIAASADPKTVACLGENGTCKLINLVDGKVAAESNTDHQALRLEQERSRDTLRQKAKLDRMEKRIPELEKAKADEVESKAKQKMARDKAAEALAAKVTEVDKEKGALAEIEKNLAAAKLAVEEAMKKVEAVNKEVATKQEAIAKVDKAREEAQKEVSKHDQVLAAADEAIERASKAIPAFQSEIESEKGLFTQLQTKQEEATKLLKTTASPIACRVSHDGKSIISVNSDNTLRLVRFQSPKPEAIVSLSSPIDAVAKCSLGVASDGRIFVGCDSNPIQSFQFPGYWKLERTIGTATESPFSDRVTSLDFSADGTRLLVGSGPPSRYGDIKILATDSWSVVHDLGEVHSDTVLTARFSPDGRWIASGGADKIVRIFDSTGKFVRTLEGHTHHILALSWNDDGQTLASGSADATVKVWDVFSGQQQRTISGFGKEVTSLGYVKQSQQLMTVSADRQARLYDASNGKSIRAFEGTPDALYAASLGEDGSYIVAGGQDGTLTIWNLENVKAIQSLKAK